jgi:hypothetical protein
MTIDELTRALVLLEARVAKLERQIDMARDLISRSLIIPLPMEPPGAPRLTEDRRKA